MEVNIIVDMSHEESAVILKAIEEHNNNMILIETMMIDLMMSYMQKMKTVMMYSINNNMCTLN